MIFCQSIRCFKRSVSGKTIETVRKCTAEDDPGLRIAAFFQKKRPVHERAVGSTAVKRMNPVLVSGQFINVSVNRQLSAGDASGTGGQCGACVKRIPEVFVRIGKG